MYTEKKNGKIANEMNTTVEASDKENITPNDPINPAAPDAQGLENQKPYVKTSHATFSNSIEKLDDMPNVELKITDPVIPANVDLETVEIKDELSDD